ncbi:hypothetical protein V8F20_009823 [Naviculisporaceae sp. PSN 640]
MSSAPGFTTQRSPSPSQSQSTDSQFNDWDVVSIASNNDLTVRSLSDGLEVAPTEDYEQMTSAGSDHGVDTSVENDVEVDECEEGYWCDGCPKFEGLFGPYGFERHSERRYGRQEDYESEYHYEGKGDYEGEDGDVGEDWYEGQGDNEKENEYQAEGGHAGEEEFEVDDGYEGQDGYVGEEDYEGEDSYEAEDDFEGEVDYDGGDMEEHGSTDTKEEITHRAEDKIESHGKEDSKEKPRGHASKNALRPFIFVVGKSGSGKSTFIEDLTDCKLNTGKSTIYSAGPRCRNWDPNQAWTAPNPPAPMHFEYQVCRCHIGGQEYLFIELPSLNFSRADLGLHFELYHHLLKENVLDRQRIIMAGVIFVFDASQHRLTPTEIHNIKYMKALFGPTLFKYMLIVCTKWDLVRPELCSETFSNFSINIVDHPVLRSILNPTPPFMGKNTRSSSYKGAELYHHGLYKQAPGWPVDIFVVPITSREQRNQMAVNVFRQFYDGVTASATSGLQIRRELIGPVGTWNDGIRPASQRIIERGFACDGEIILSIDENDFVQVLDLPPYFPNDLALTLHQPDSQKTKPVPPEQHTSLTPKLLAIRLRQPTSPKTKPLTLHQSPGLGGEEADLDGQALGRPVNSNQQQGRPKQEKEQ